jgi:hypothetical protein
VVKHQELVPLVESVGARRRSPERPDKHHPRREARRRTGGEVLQAWVKQDPDAIRLTIKSSKETFFTNKVKIKEETITTPTLFFQVGVNLTVLSSTHSGE